MTTVLTPTQRADICQLARAAVAAYQADTDIGELAAFILKYEATVQEVETQRNVILDASTGLCKSIQAIR